VLSRDVGRGVPASSLRIRLPFCRAWPRFSCGQRTGGSCVAFLVRACARRCDPTRTPLPSRSRCSLPGTFSTAHKYGLPYQQPASPCTLTGPFAPPLIGNLPAVLKYGEWSSGMGVIAE
jgi:hypothetical protein